MTFVSTRATGESHFYCETCPATFNAPEKGMTPQTLKPLATLQGWHVIRQAAEWRHYCPTCARFRNGRLL